MNVQELALKWWNNLSPYDEQHSLREKYCGENRTTFSLTVNEIKNIYIQEVNDK